MLNNDKPITTQQKIHKKTKIKDYLINSGVLIGTSLAGALTGFRILKADEVKLQDKGKKAQALEDEISDLNSQKSKLLSKQQRTINEFEEFQTNQLRDELKMLFVHQVANEKEGKYSTIPNCLMIEGLDPEKSQEFIDWTAKNTACRFVQIKHTDSLLQTLKESEKNYQKTRNRTLIYVDKMEDLINPHITAEDEIGDLKRFMQQCSKKYHSTLIFDTQDPSKLDHIALQPHRVKKISIKKDSEQLKTMLNEKSNLNQQIDTIEKTIKSKTTTMDILKNFKPKSTPKTLLAGLGLGFIVGGVALIINKFVKGKNNEKFSEE